MDDNLGNLTEEDIKALNEELYSIYCTTTDWETGQTPEEYSGAGIYH